MAIFPAALPTAADIADAGVDLSTNPHSALHDDLRDEVVAIAAELGVDPAGAEATVGARLTAIDGRSADVLTPTSPWTGTLYTIKSGAWVTLVVSLTRSSVTVDGPWTVGTVSADWRPNYGTVSFAAAYQVTTTAGTGITQSAYCQVGTSGVISVQSRIVNAVALRASVTWSRT